MHFHIFFCGPSGGRVKRCIPLSVRPSRTYSLLEIAKTRKLQICSDMT